MRILASIALILGLAAGLASPASARQTIAQIASGNSNFSTLVAALKATHLAGVLNAPGKYTVFAPTNAAFDALPEGTVANLLKLRNLGKLKAILLYHVVGKRIPAAAIPTGVTRVATLNGKSVHVRKNAHGVSVNAARVTMADLHASNGVIHVIDSVLLP